ncbi:SusC/RagA family TonB-linked outer membrane protein [Zunongwangia sp. HGR-M22]|uniref:SusC/RagA family TonB-linked outer membrane protein n=1 Tax=Zunongwangia sp. HGR-M22 TaxID=3015168 RepID=UPI0022DD7355|nr:SusC/RagA family TonB-linked outer membrane protein [Zunongwangia sp. HGR-M22]WBL24344.1 SusC/RagA family TonB-linked outer membrane protein [Zunongwangia sp. HGR-M22]
MNKKHDSSALLPKKCTKGLCLKFLKLSLFICLAVTSTFNMYAKQFQGPIAINVKNVSLANFISELEAKSDYVFLYDDKVNSSAAPITINISAPLESILKQAFKSSNITYNIIDNQVVIKYKEAPQQKMYTVKGTVTDEYGIPLLGVNILIDGTNNWGLSKENGEFSLEIFPDDILIFRYLGFESQKIAVDGKKRLDVVLKQDITQLGQVELVASNGYTKIPKEQTTGALNVMTNEEIEEIPTVDLNQRLEGKIPGLKVDPRTGALSIRGLTSYNGNNSPLIVIDGFPMPLEDFKLSKRGVSGSSILSYLNPEDIETITVLKDASAAAIWGSRAANGVIVITTKQGKSSDPTVSISSTITYGEKIDLDKLRVMNAAQYVDFETDLIEKGYLLDNSTNWQSENPSAAQNAIFQFQRGEITASQRDNILQNLSGRNNLSQINEYLLQNSFTQQYDISVSGGNKRNTYFISAGYNEDDATMKSNESNSYNVTVNNTFQLKDFLRLETGLNYVSSKYQENTTANAALSNVDKSALRPYDYIVDENGKSLDKYFLFSNQVAKDFENQGYLPFSYNYLDQLNFSNVRSDGQNIRINAKLTATITDWLDVEGSGMYTSIINESGTLNELDSYYTRILLNEATSIDPNNGKLVYGIPYGAYLNTAREKNESQSLRFQANVNKKLWEDHMIDWLAGAEIREERREGSARDWYGYDVNVNTSKDVNETEYYTTIYGWQTLLGSSNNSILKYRDRYLSYYSLLSYNYKDRFHLSGSIRLDDYNLLGASRSNRALPLWSVGGKWNFNNENFMKNINWLDNGAFRLSYGKSGSAPAGGFGFSNTIISVGTNDFDTELPLTSISLPANSKLKWQTTNTLNLGLDFSILKGKLSGSLDVYTKKTKDILSNFPFNPTYGFSYLQYNTGTMEGNGIDIGLNAILVDTDNFKWNSNLNFAYADNEITDSRFEITSASQLINQSQILNKPLGSVYAYRWAGLDATGQSLIYDNDGNTIDSSEGILSVEKEDLKYMGTVNAPYFGGFMNNFSYKGISLGVQITYYFGHVFRNQVLQNYPSFSGVHYGAIGKDELIVDRWRAPGDEANTNVPGLDNLNFNSINRYKLADINVLSADNIRLQQLSLGYNIPAKWLKDKFINAVNLNLAARNIGLIWTKNDLDIDPMYLSTNNYNTLPPQRSYTFQISCSF